MKHFCLFLSLVFFLNSNAQVTVRGKLLDRQTNEAVISASVGIKGKATGTISNEEGVFQLTVFKDEQILVSCLGYQPIAVPASEFTSEIKILYLEQSEEKLEEVMVSKIPPHQMLLEAIAASTARLNKPILLHTYYREFAKNNGKYTSFADGLLDYHVTGTVKKTTTETVVLQNRSVNLLPPEEEEDGAFGSVFSVQQAVVSKYSMSRLYQDVLEKKKHEQYDFELKSKKEAGKELYLISFSPKAEIEEMLVKGTVLFDPQTKLIQEVEIYAAPSHLQYAKTINVLIVKVTIQDFKLKTAYKMSGSNYVLSYCNHYAKVKVFNKKRLNETLESRSDLIVTDFEKDKPFDKKTRFKKRNLYDKPTDYQTKFWQQSNAIVLTSDEEKIIADLEKSSASAIPAH
ncbi:carboxypeptidase-like regulatory domain-containing protein [Flavobacterium sp.]|uniref:carboxypeptidase-like regulatory domain-containing protein n=1 Tax=Flavobacterium sp. TaxID=239 RepID=UPI0039E6D21B